MRDDADHRNRAQARADERWENASPWISATTALIVVSIIVIAVCVWFDQSSPSITETLHGQTRSGAL